VNAIGHITRWRRAGLFTAAVVTALTCAFGLPGQAPKPKEYQVKAAFLLNFGRFIEWPASSKKANAKFPICVLGEDPFGGALDEAAADELIDGSPIVVKRIPGLQHASHCRVLYVGSSEESRWEAILAEIKRLSVLTVSDMPRFVARGGMIQFVMDDNRVRFEVNLDAAGRAGLQVSSLLLKLAVTVKRSP